MLHYFSHDLSVHLCHSVRVPILSNRIIFMHHLGSALVRLNAPDDYGVNDLGAFCVKKKLECSVKKDFLSEARPNFNLGKQLSFRASLNLLAECKVF